MPPTTTGVLLLLACSLAAQSDSTPNSLLGTWKLNVARSTAEPGPLPRSEKRTYSASADGTVKLTVEGVDGGGNRFAYGYAARFDGSDYPMTGTGTRNGGDTLAVTRIDAYAVQALVKKAGVIVNRARLEVSKDRKTLTISETGKNDKGQETRGLRLYEKE